MQFTPRLAVTLDFSLLMFSIFHEHEPCKCRMAAIYSLFLPLSAMLVPVLSVFVHSSSFRCQVGTPTAEASSFVPCPSGCQQFLQGSLSSHSFILSLWAFDKLEKFWWTLYFHHLLFPPLVTISGRKKGKTRKKFKTTFSFSSSTEFSYLTSRDIGWKIKIRCSFSVDPFSPKPGHSVWWKELGLKF